MGGISDERYAAKYNVSLNFYRFINVSKIFYSDTPSVGTTCRQKMKKYSNLLQQKQMFLKFLVLLLR